jgi:hypothetical protein
MLEAIEQRIEGPSSYPDRAYFVDAEEPWAGKAIARAADQDQAVVLVSADGTKRILRPERL